MKVCIVAANNIRYSPYIYFYIEILRQLKIDYELIIPLRNDIEDPFEGVITEISWDKTVPTPISYYKYMKKVHKIISAKNFDALVLLTSNIAVFSNPWITRDYKGRYLVDIRDFSHENNMLFRLLEKRTIDNSYINIISSEKFKSFLPSSKYNIAHNIPVNYTEIESFKKNINSPITIGYLGTGNYIDNAFALAKLVEKDDRFQLQFWGPSIIEEKLKIKGVVFNNHITYRGSYLPNQKEIILKESDILFNLYGYGTPLLDCALSNKLYDALIYKKGILVCPGTYMAEMAGPLGFSMDLTETKNLEEVYQWYVSINDEEVTNYAKQKINLFRNENENTKKLIKGFFTGLELQ